MTEDNNLQHFAEDMRSTNGTRCNGKTMTESVALSDGDELELGDTRIEYSSRTFPSNEAAAAAQERVVEPLKAPLTSLAKKAIVAALA